MCQPNLSSETNTFLSRQPELEKHFTHPTLSGWDSVDARRETQFEVPGTKAIK